MLDKLNYAIKDLQETLSTLIQAIFALCLLASVATLSTLALAWVTHGLIFGHWDVGGYDVIQRAYWAIKYR